MLTFTELLCDFRSIVPTWNHLYRGSRGPDLGIIAVVQLPKWYTRISTS